MKLADWLQQQNTTVAAFAVEHGISRSHLYAAMRGQRWLSRDMALRIEEATNGAVTCRDFLHAEPNSGEAA